MIMLHYIDITMYVMYMLVIHWDLKVIFLLISMIKNTFFNTKTVHILRKMYQNNHVYMTAFLATIYI